MPSPLDDILKRYPTTTAPAAVDSTATPTAPDDAFTNLQKAYPAAAAKAADATATQTDTPKTDIRDASKGIADAAKGVDTALKNFPQGAKDVVLTALRGANYVNQKVPALQSLDTAVLGQTPDKYQADIDRLTAQTKAYEASPDAQQPGASFGRTMGQQALVLPATLGAGMALRAGGSAIGPVAGQAANWLTGGGGTVSNAVAGGGAGAINNALTYGTSDAPLADTIGQGALGGMVAGGAMRAIPAVAGNIANVGRTVLDSLSEAGQGRIANRLIDQYAGTPLSLNTNPLVPGSTPTLADSAGNVGVSRLQNTLRDAPGTGSAIVDQERANSAARGTYLEEAAGTPQDIAAATAARNANEGPAISAVFQNAGQADALPVVQKIDDILAGPSGKRPAIATALNTVKNLIVSPGPAGTQVLESDPAVLYQSVRNHIRDMLDTRLTPGANNSAIAASSELGQVKNVLDDSIESGAPGFKQSLADYANASRPIGAQQYLQGLNLTDQTGNTTLQKMKSALAKIDQQRSQPGVNGAKTLSQGDLDTLQNVHDDLLRQSNTQLGKGYGSNTEQNLLWQDSLGTNPLLSRVLSPEAIGSAAGIGLGHLVGGGAFAPFGEMLGSGIGMTMGHGLRNALTSQNDAVKQQLLARILNPSLYAPSGGRLSFTAGNNLLAPAAAGAIGTNVR